MVLCAPCTRRGVSPHKPASDCVGRMDGRAGGRTGEVHPTSSWLPLQPKTDCGAVSAVAFPTRPSGVA